MIDLSSRFNISRTDYQNDNFLSFLKKVKFNFTIPSIHIAGTNGKGSTSEFIANIYISSGKKVGLYISPYLSSLSETIKVNHVGIKDEDIVSIVDEYDKEIRKANLSLFEVETFVAFMFFMRQKCDICVIECGMGGEYDATNIFIPILSIITSISLEHTSFLGRSISEIAKHKAGIIKDEVPVIIGELDEEAKQTIAECAKYKSSKVIEVGKPHEVILNESGHTFSYDVYHDLHISSLAYYSVINACLAIEAVKTLNNIIPIDLCAIKNGLDDTVLPFRLERLEKHPNVILDGAHNLEASKKMIDAFLRYNAINPHPIHIIFASFKDKNIVLMLAELGILTSDIKLTTFPHVRARDEDDYFLFSDEYQFVGDHLNLVKKTMIDYPNDWIIITGSLAFVMLVKKELYSE